MSSVLVNDDNNNEPSTLCIGSKNIQTPHDYRGVELGNRIKVCKGGGEVVRV